MEKTTKDFITCAENILGSPAIQNVYDDETLQTASALLKRIVAAIPAPRLLTPSGFVDASAIHTEDSNTINTLCGVIPDLQLKLIAGIKILLSNTEAATPVHVLGHGIIFTLEAREWHDWTLDLIAFSLLAKEY